MHETPSPTAKRPRFVVDAHLGRLAKYLRMLGFDAIYGNDLGDPLLASLSATQGRILLSRDRALLERANVSTTYEIQAKAPEDRLHDVVEHFDLQPLIQPFTRCMVCNTPFEPVRKKDVLSQIPRRTAEVFDEYFYCPNCDQVFWKGSHYDRMKGLIARCVAS